jgi:hypothetical protein
MADIIFPEGVRIGYELEFCSNAPIPLSVSRPLLEWFELGVDRSLAPRNPSAKMYEIRSREPLNVVSVDVIQLMLEQLGLVNELPPVPGWRRWTDTMTTPTSWTRWSEAMERHASSAGYSTATANSTATTTYVRPRTNWSDPVDVDIDVDADPRSYQHGDRVAVSSETQPNQTEFQFAPTGKNIFTTRNCGMHVHISWTNKRLAHVLYGHLADVLTRKVKPFDERKSYCCPDFDSPRSSRYNALRWVHVESGHFEVRLFNGTMKLRGIVNNLKMIRNEALLVARASQAAIRTQSANPHGGLGSPVMG